MADKNKVGLEAIFDNEDFQKGVNAYNSAVSDASRATEEGGSAMSGVWEMMQSVGAIALEAIVAGVLTLTTAMGFAVVAALDVEQSMARVEFVTNNVAERTGVASDEVFALADSLAQVVPIDDDVIASAISMGLTFDGVNEDNVQPLIKAAADLSEWTGKDLPNSMKELSLAITDPDRAMRLFRDANITLTDQQEKTLKKLEETGDTAGTTSFILEQLANKGILGLAEVMGDTAKGKMTIMQTAIGNLQEGFGGGLLDALGGVFDRITEFANNPETVAFFTDLGKQIGDFASNLLDRVPDIMTSLDEMGQWFQDNKPLIVGILAALGVAIAAFAATVITSAISAAVALAPIIIAMVAIGAVAALLYTAWTENWGGIQEQMGALWATVQPILQGLWDWLSVNVPIALQYLSDFWTNVLLPAIQDVFIWVWSNVIPTLIEIIQWLQVNVPAAISTLSDFWTNTLLPAIQAVWSWIDTNLMPLFEAVSELMDVAMTLAITALAGLWQNVLLPAIQAVGSWLSANVLPIFESLSETINNKVMPALQPFADFLGGALKGAFDGITNAIQTVIGWVKDLTEALKNIELPPALTPGSPTPFEIGLRGINDELKRMSNATIPAVTHEMNVLGTVRDVPGANSSSSAGMVNSTSSSVKNYLFGAQFNVNNSNGLLDILKGLA